MNAETVVVSTHHKDGTVEPTVPAGGNKVEMMVHQEPFYKKIWRPMLAGIFAFIVLFDFMIMPVIYELSNDQIADKTAVELSLRFNDVTAQVQALKTFTEKRTWNPLTLLGGGMFYVAFGALLTGAAVTRGMEKTKHASKGKFIR